MALRIVATTALAGMIAACGFKGPLYLPPPPNARAGTVPRAAPAPTATPVPVLLTPGTATLPDEPNSTATTPQ